VIDNLQGSATQTLTITIGGITILLDRLPDAGFGVPYSQFFSATGGAPPYTWAVVGGSLPPGLVLDSGGALQGTPALIGSYSFTVQVTDNSGVQLSKLYTLNVVSPLQLNTTSLPSAGLGVPYSQTLQASGGTPPYFWRVELGALPLGLSLDGNTGTISGTATVPGPSSFGILLTDSGSQLVRRNYTIVTGSPVTVTSVDPLVTVGISFTYKLTATGGTPPYRWSIVNGSLPPGLALDGTAGIISGAATTAGNYPVTLLATDSLNLSGQKVLTFHVSSTAIPAITIGSPDTAATALQPAITVSLAGPYTADIAGTLALSFMSVLNADEPSVRFSNSTRSVDFTIPAGSTQATFTGVTGPLKVLTGTVGGTVTLTVSIPAAGNSGAVTKQTAINSGVPVITAVTLQTTSTGVTVTVTGYSSTLDMISGQFHFAPQGDVTVQLSSAFATWYNDPHRSATGSEFTLTMPFSVSATSVTVSLTNSIGTSAAVSQ
jgi:hypothetical protein